MVDWIKKAPTSLLITMTITVGFIVLGTLGGFIYLTAIGVDTTEFRTFINTVANIIALPLLGLTGVASVSAAKSASKAEDQTNSGPGGLNAHIDDRIEHAREEEGKHHG
jgi:hypothetical protein